jgi:hypothetical protein
MSLRRKTRMPKVVSSKFSFTCVAGLGGIQGFKGDFLFGTALSIDASAAKLLRWVNMNVVSLGRAELKTWFEKENFKVCVI